MALRKRTITLTTEQRRLLDLFVAALESEPEVPIFTCQRLARIGFTWIMHPGFYHDTRMADWDDMLDLDKLGLIELNVTADESEDSCFRLTPISSLACEQCNAAALPDGVAVITIEVDASDRT